jgi:hypothetical protein
VTVRVRLAQPHHLSEMVALGKKHHEAGNYSAYPYNAVLARRTIKEHMTDRDSRAWITVKEVDGKEVIVGLLLGQIAPAGWFALLQATDTAFIADQGGDLLLSAFVAWCKLRKVARIDMGISAGSGRNPALDRMFRREGFEVSGTMYHMNLGGEAQ